MHRHPQAAVLVVLLRTNDGKVDVLDVGWMALPGEDEHLDPGPSTSNPSANPGGAPGPAGRHSLGSEGV